MWPDQLLDADHQVPRALGGVNSPLRWAHRSCNRRAGGQLARRLQLRHVDPPPPPGW